MSLFVCGTRYLTWAPYSSPVPLTSRVKHELFSGECETVHDCSTEIPTSTAELTKCATCAKTYTNLDRYYGCTWCQEILAPLAASGRALTWTEVQTYINQTKEQRAPVKDKWDTLSQCEKAKWVRSTCLANDAQTFPYSSAATGASSSSNGLSTGAIVGIVFGVLAAMLLGLGFIAWRVRVVRESKLNPETRAEREIQKLWKNIGTLNNNSTDVGKAKRRALILKFTPLVDQFHTRFQRPPALYAFS